MISERQDLRTGDGKNWLRFLSYTKLCVMSLSHITVFINQQLVQSHLQHYGLLLQDLWNYLYVTDAVIILGEK